jgi:hypothetical protein
MEALEWLGIPDETIGKNEKFGPIVKAKENLYIENTLINNKHCWALLCL